MRKTLLAMAVLLLLFPCAWAQEEAAPAMPGPEQMAEAMKLMQPGEHHRHMARLVGQWKAAGKMWAQPGAPPVEHHGGAKISSLMDGRYFLTEYEGTFMGMPFKGMGIDGYDNHKKKHVGAWIDTMGTMIMTYEGDCSDDHKVVTTYAEFDDPMTGMHMNMRQVTTEIDADHFRYEAFAKNPSGEGEMKVFEINYERQ